MKKTSLLLLLLSISLSFFAQDRKEDIIKTTNFIKMKKVVPNLIPGAPILGQPQLITGTKNEIRVEKHGMIYPALYDWNHDGKRDLLLGEFETGEKGSYIKVFLNKGTNKKPSYTGEYQYATDVNGDTLTVYTWCCIGIHPSVIDFDGDGYLDILSGQYNPGLISWWRGGKNGFLPKQYVAQEGWDGKNLKAHVSVPCKAPWDPESLDYWNYTSANFGDFNGDGLPDLFVGGFLDFRVALNEGTRENPKFGLRKYMHFTDGKILTINRPSDEYVQKFQNERLDYMGLSGVVKSYIHPVDWDNDGVLDLLITHSYTKPGDNLIEFFKGVNTDDGLRFEHPIPLFKQPEGEKLFPGCVPQICIDDYNNDGVKDIIVGFSVPTINGYECVPEIAYRWVSETGIEMPGKDAGRTISYYKGGIDEIKEKIKKDPNYKRFVLGNLDNDKYLTLRHRGYVYVMYGKKNPVKAATPKTIKAGEKEIRQPINFNTTYSSNFEGAINFDILYPKKVGYRGSFDISVGFDLKKGWHIYSDCEMNKKGGYIPTLISFSLPSGCEGIEVAGPLQTPKEVLLGGASVYQGDNISFKQTFRVKNTKALYAYLAKHKELSIKVKISSQACGDGYCEPPVEQEVEIPLNF
jgi:FG-GAP repeat.